MTTKHPKVYVANLHSNRISHRALNSFERLNPKYFSLSHSVHGTWAEAQAVLVDAREKQLERARNDVKLAERALAKALAMKEPS